MIGRAGIAFLAVLAGLSLVFVTTVMLILMLDRDTVVRQVDPIAFAPADKPCPVTHRLQPDDNQPKAPAAPPEQFNQPDEQNKNVSSANDAFPMGLGNQFEEKRIEDLERLGPSRHQRMERLWLQGRRPRGQPESIQKLESLLAQYPDTNRAGCAALELGHHYLRLNGLEVPKRRQMAEKYWRMVEDRYRDTICEYNSNALALSKLSLATWVYRYSDPGLARRMLMEIIRQHQDQTDHLGQSLEVTAKKLLEQLN